MLPNFNNNGPCFELFNSQLDITKYWRFKGKISKDFEPHTKTNTFTLLFGGVSALSTPIDEKRSLQINNSCLIFQFILYNTKTFSIEICIRDKSDTKRRYNITTSVKEVDSKSLYIKIPLIDYPLNIWTNLLIDLGSLTQHYFKTQTFKTIESIHITGNIKIRKIFSLRSKKEPVLKSIDMGKSIPLVNLLFTENGSIISTNIKILGINNTTHINTVNIDSNSFHNKKSSPSPKPNNHGKYSTTSDIMVNRHKQIYNKKNKDQHNINNNINNNININININNLKKEHIAVKLDENKRFLKELPKFEKLTNDLRYKKGKNIKKVINNIHLNDEGDNNNSNFIINNNNTSNINGTNNINAVKNNFVEKNKSLGNYVQNQKNKKRNKSNNPYLRPKINKKNENSELKEQKSDKKINKLNIKQANKKTEKTEKVEKKAEKKDKNIEIIDNNYYDSKEKEISFEDYSPDTKAENKFKFNNIPLGNTLLNKKQTNEEEKESNIEKNKIVNNNPNKASIQKMNKFSNYNMLLDSGIDIKNIPVYDSIEEVAEWPGGDWNAAQGEGVGDKLIRLDNTKKVEKKNSNEINIDDEDLLEFGSLEKKNTYRPYTPPIEELVQVDPNKMKGDSNMKVSLDKKSSIKTVKTLKNYENLVYNEEKGLLYDPSTNKYYDIKAK